MSRVFGVDIRDTHVRVAALRVGYRKLDLDGLAEERVSEEQDAARALRVCFEQLGGHPDTVVTTVDGADCFYHRLTFPESARKRLSDLLPFELEAVLPLDIEELVFDQLALGRDASTTPGTFSVLAVAARQESVEQRLQLIAQGFGRQAERVGCSTVELGQLAHLCPDLRSSEPIAIVDLGFSRIDVCVLKGGEVTLIRALSVGIDCFPDEAELCVARLRQTLASALTSTGEEVNKIVLLGDGANLSGIDSFLASRLGVEVQSFPPTTLGETDAVLQSRLPVFGRALCAAMHGVRGKGLDLRKGALSFERGYEHVKERAPLLGGLAAAVLLSFLFAVWAESRALTAENEALVASLEEITASTFGERTGDPDDAEIALGRARKIKPEDPMPYMDGFGVAVALSETMPSEIVHDVEELEVSKGKIKLRGIVDSADDAQKVAKALGENRCIKEPNITKISQVVNSERERYMLEAEVMCPEDAVLTSKTKTKKEAAE